MWVQCVYYICILLNVLLYSFNCTITFTITYLQIFTTSLRTLKRCISTLVLYIEFTRQLSKLFAQINGWWSFLWIDLEAFTEDGVKDFRCLAKV